ncbi:hypothetical protein A1O7_00080 [Cladophialophora yegresii CBS 114405]|uniref:Calcineurin-like phosphoesterase domain-containing protein n=1 Tax=Cladophialophora yegresii CBS 114405 TaxID=1182544 RepID=W9WFG6_9EURO|nr:uncharacterized protein A1O7_00080 [Cladophialophora yegresii CBS 114405]EXJ63745.1 hypothetical protein A1O7_00080 [Cladophialophora yegresii CBS 114405]
MTTRRTRIVCISDTHNQTPKLPSGDVLIHAGDLSNQGTFSELQKTVAWIKKSKFQVKIIVCGNHDITCDEEFYQQYGPYFHHGRMEDAQRCRDLVKSDPSIVYLNHEARHVTITHEDGQQSRLKVFGSPYSPARGFRAFWYSTESAPQLWDQIPLDSDIVVTHTPAKYHRDETGKGGSVGCEVLRQTLWRVRPRLFVCGHIHEAYGVEIVNWDLSSLNVRFKERSLRECTDPEPGSKKQFRVDLTSRARSLALKNDGGTGNLVPPTELCRLRGVEVDGPADWTMIEKRDYDTSDDAASDAADEQELAAREQHAGKAVLPDVPHPPTPPFPDFEKAERPASYKANNSHHIRHLGTRGQGGPASSPRSDQEALSGREGREETCIVNAAFMATNFPHNGGKRFHKPIVIDLDLPVVDGNKPHQATERETS